jgi:hypothetical protein
MNQNFTTYFRARRRLRFQLNAFFLILVFASFQPVSFGQKLELTRARVSSLSVVERAALFEPTISRIAAEERVDPYLLWTIAYLETRFRPWLRSPAGAEGLMQFIPATARRFNLSDPYRAEPAIRAAARYVRFLQNRFGGRIDSALAGYNAGEGAVDAYLAGKTLRSGRKIINPRGVKTVGGVPPYRETVSYVARGLLVYRLLRARQIFPGAFLSLSVYPSAVSVSVARVRLKDPEICFNGSLLTQIAGTNFPNVESNKFSRRDIIDFQTDSAETVSKNLTEDVPIGEQPINEKTEVFYEPRTGNRFAASDGKMQRLAESGELIVGASVQNGQPTEIRARGTFFGGKAAPK